MSRTIRDPVHGYIRLDEVEYRILQLPVFMRLHHVRQMPTGYLVYPGVNISRFVHSLGVMHLASKIMTQLIASVDKDKYNELFPAIDDRRIVSVVRAAGLLHDIGHGPFSHSSEQTMRKALIELHADEMDEAKKITLEEDEKKLPVHEYFSYKLMTESGELKEILDENLGARNVATLITKTKNTNTEVAKNHDGLSILRKIVSSQLDADRMDYIIRDAAWAGVSYGSIDPDRVIGNMAIRKVKDNYELAIHERALNAVESIVDSRFKMYKWVYHHHMVVATEELSQRLLAWLYDTITSIKKQFHWKAFQEGELSDVEIEATLKEQLNTDNNDVLNFKGFKDRRFLPVSILKRREDHAKLHQDIRQAIAPPNSCYNAEVATARTTKKIL
jgi:HD superfamily phosphohydrolase